MLWSSCARTIGWLPLSIPWNTITSAPVGTYVVTATLSGFRITGGTENGIRLVNSGVDITGVEVTGIHGTHVFVGVLWALYLLAGHHRKPFSQSNHLGIENFGLYWHFVDIVWIVLFTVIYLI